MAGFGAVITPRPLIDLMTYPEAAFVRQHI
jgi:hypothetical protein